MEGAFTGARKGGKAGVFEMAHGGTLLLDEVGEMPSRLQSNFLRAIEQREIMRLGDSRIVPINVRLIASTHRNLREMVSRGQFREDLYYRLNVLSLPVPTLRERGDDVLLIADKFLREFYDMQGKSYGIFSEEAAQVLLDYGWPGNIRQLRNSMERLSVMTAGGLLEAYEVERALQIQEFNGEVTVPRNPWDSPEAGPVSAAQPANGASGAFRFQEVLKQQKAEHEKELIYSALRECGGSKIRAAQKLGISRTTLWRKLQRGAGR